MSEKRAKKTARKKSVDKKEEEKKLEAEKIVLEKAEKAEEIEEKKEEKAEPDKGQVFHENKILFNVLMVLALLVIAFVVFLILYRASNTITVNGVQYNVVQQGQLTFYNAKIPVVYQGKPAQYNFYLRNNPQLLENEIPFNGTLYILPGLVVNVSNDLACSGDGSVAMVNLGTLYKVIGANVTASGNLTCNPQAGYVYLNIQPSSKPTSIQEISPACYQINVNNCQVLAATERYMVETFSALKNSNYSY